MRRILFYALMAASIAGCEGTTDPIDGIGGDGPGSGSVTQAQVSGDWQFTLDRTTSTCPTGSLPDNQVLIAHLDVLSNGTLTAVTSGWQIPPAASRPLDGGVSFTTGFGTLILRGTTTNTAMELRGTFTAAGAFGGTLTDPRAGSFPVFSSGSCSYNVAGVKA